MVCGPLLRTAAGSFGAKGIAASQLGRVAAPEPPPAQRGGGRSHCNAFMSSLIVYVFVERGVQCTTLVGNSLFESADDVVQWMPFWVSIAPRWHSNAMSQYMHGLFWNP